MSIAKPAKADEGVQTARVAVRILELLASRDEVGVTEIARETDMTKPRAYRHLRTLLAMGYAVQRDGSDRYARGPKLLALARVIGQSAEDGVIELARPVMQGLHEEFDHSFNLSLVYGDSASIVESLPGKALVGITVKLGEPLPLHSTAAGKLILADRLKKQGTLPAGKLVRFTQYTITDPADLRQELATVAARGWADAPQQVVLGINAVSSPVYDHRGDLVAMVSAMDSIQFIPPDPPAGLITAMREAAAEISARLAL
ncbi:IclR family transcriptional regulator [Croceibacterium aestuarii]|uniref:IclR family transcriptional regulator n=1 Tax=Croceibacterium aestuarii TaxID=3064139 RepID=UPI00272E2AAD|nr:IclR family transcriptional regulator [Croceibacterium sp. D39]